MADNIRTIKSSFNTLKNGTIKNETKNYGSATGFANLIADTAHSVSALADVSNSLQSSVMTIGTNLSLDNLVEDAENLVTSASDASRRYINEKINRIKTLWDTKVDITVESLLGEVTSYAVGLDKLGSTLYRKLCNVISNMMGVNISDSDSIGNALLDDYFKTLSADGSLTETINQLHSVKIMASTLSLTVDVYNAVVQIKEVYEGLSDTLSIATGFASSASSGGTSAVEAVNTTANVAQKETSKLRTLLLYSLKKFIFPLKVKLPQLIVGSIDTLSARKAMMESSFWGGLFDDEYYENVKYTIAFENAVKNAVVSVRNASSKVEGSVENFSKLFKSSVTDAYMSEITALSRKTAGIKDFPEDPIQNSNISDSNTKSNTEDTSELNPITSVESLIKVSATIYGAL